jgi:nicotinic acid phosphoribosyltransferase
MPHSLVLIFGDTVKAAEAFDRDLEADVPRIVLIDTFKDEAEEALRVAHALGDRLYGIRLDTPAERGRVTADLVKEVRARSTSRASSTFGSSCRAACRRNGSATSRRPRRRSIVPVGSHQRRGSHRLHWRHRGRSTAAPS